MTEKAKQLGAQPIDFIEDWHGSGLTKREYFAGLAMQGLIAAQTYSVTDINLAARHSANCADALLEELSKTE